MKQLNQFSRAIVAIVMMLGVSITTLAHDFYVGGVYYNILNKTAKTVKVTYSGSSYDAVAGEYTGDVVIPNSVTYGSTTYSVTSIGSYAFRDCTGLKSITIPNSVTSIGNDAFWDCSGLTEVNITDLSAWCKIDFEHSYSNPLYYAKHLKLKGTEITNLVIPNDITEIKRFAFSGCTGLTSVTIPNSVTSIGSAFWGCSGLTSVTIPNSVTSIGSSAFGDCTGLTEVNITDLSAWCKIDFEYSYSNPLRYAKHLKLNGTEITNLVIPNDITEIKQYAFYGCTGLKSITIPSSVTSIGSSVFSGCTGLTSITIPSSVTSIGYSVFRGCSGLTEVTIPNSVTSIGSYAFRDCTGLTSVTIPNSVTSIGDAAFKNTPWYNNKPDGVVYINNVLYQYKGTMPGGTSIDIKDGIVSISGSAFYGCTGLKSITIGNSVTSIGSSVFRGCSGLTEVTIPNSVTSIGSSVFSGCTGLKSITIGNSVTSIGSSVFSGCTGLKSITIPNSVTSIGNDAFWNCSGLTSITIPNSVTSIGNSAFLGCDGLTEVNITDLSAWCKIDFSEQYSNPLYYAKHLINGTEITNLVIPNDITEIKDYAFRGCTGLTEVTIPNSVTSIGSSVFSGCTGLTSVTIGNSVTSIGSSAFYGCTGLTEATIPNSVTSIGDWAFSCCSGLTSVTIPNSVTSIGNSAFRSCDGLTSITIPNSVTSIGNSAFRGCTDFKSITIPNSVTSIGNDAFWNCSSLTSVTIGNSVTSIGDEVFKYCSGLNKIISLNPTPPTCASEESFYSNNYTEATLYVPKDSYAKYFIDGVWGKFTNIVKVETLVSSIKLNATSIQLDKGTIYTLSATINPTDATITDIIWTSSNPQVATVDQSGMVTALSEGIAIITATTIDGSDVSASCNVAVNNVETKISLSKTEASLPVNEIMTLNYTIVPSTTSVQWSTSDPNIAAIKVNSDNSVTVVGMADGIATITATATDGSDVSASCVVTVGNAGITDVKSDNTATEVARYDINGRKLSQPSKGINIIKMSDGSTRKEWVKE